MGMKPRKAPTKTRKFNNENCDFDMGIIRSWEYCQCSVCIPKQIAVLETRLEKAKRKEGVN